MADVRLERAVDVEQARARICRIAGRAKAVKHNSGGSWDAREVEYAAAKRLPLVRAALSLP